MPLQRQQLLDYLRQPIPDTSRNARYVRLIEHQLDEDLLGLDQEWLTSGGLEGYRARSQTNIIGRLAFAWHTPGLSLHHDTRVLAALESAYLAVAEHITAEGQLIWEGDKDMYWAGSHEHAWRLEPLLAGWIWVGDHLPEATRTVVRPALRRAADWLIANPCDQHNNRGAVWCAIATMCGIYYGKPAMLQAVEDIAEPIMAGVILDDGEIGEHTEQYAGGGPCTNYTYTGLGYVYLYALFTGNAETGDRLLKGMKWLATYNTLSGYPLVAGASVRVAKPEAAIQDALPALERCSKEDTFFGRLADNYLESLEAANAGFGGHIISPLIWAMLESGVDSDSPSLPEWYSPATRVFERPNVAYALITRGYQTGITFSVRPGPYRNIPDSGVPLRGLQTFAVDDEDPVLHHGTAIQSNVQVDDFDLSITDVAIGPHGREIQVTETDGLTVLLERRAHIWTLYAETPTSLVVVHGGATGRFRSFWSLYAASRSDIAHDPTSHALAFSARTARVYYLDGDAEVYDHSEGAETRWVLDIISTRALAAAAFSDRSFQFLETDQRALRFRDAGGAYTISLADILDGEGNIDRTSPCRIARASS